MCVYRYSIDQSRLGLPVLKILLHTNAITVPVPKSLNVRLSCFVTLCITALSYWQQFPAARVLLPHAELRHLSTSINGRRRYRLDQSTPPPAAIVRRSPTQCRRPRTPPRKLPHSSHESSHAPLALYPPRASHLAFYHHPLLSPSSNLNAWIRMQHGSNTAKTKQYESNCDLSEIKPFRTTHTFSYV